MGQIVKRKKKGRPSKADLARRTGDQTASESDIRRSLRRRNVRYNIDYDDYVDEEDEDEDEDEGRREKKLKLVLKLPHDNKGSGGESMPSQAWREARVADAPESGLSASSSEYGNKTVVKKSMDGGDDDEDDNDDDDEGEGDEDEVR